MQCRKIQLRNLVIGLVAASGTSQIQAQDELLQLEQQPSYVLTSSILDRENPSNNALTPRKLVPVSETQANNSKDVVGEAELVRERFPNGKVRIEKYVAESSRGDFVNHGKYVEYSEAGDVLVSGFYVDGQPDGQWQKIIDAKQVQELADSNLAGFQAPFTSQATYVNGQLSGDWNCTDSNAKWLFVWSFKEGKRDGLSTWFNAKSEIIQSVPYRDNLVDGMAKISRGNTLVELEFRQGKQQETVPTYYDAAKGKTRALKSQDEYLIPSELNIESQSYAENYVRYAPVDKSQIVRHGKSVTYFSNGKTASEGQYENGKRTGNFRWWYSNGQKSIEGSYQDDVEHGEFTWWHENGMKKAVGAYDLGTTLSNWKGWTPEGKLVTRVETEPTQTAKRGSKMLRK